MIEHFLQPRPPAAAPPSTTTWSPHPRVRGWASLWRKKELRRYIPCPPMLVRWQGNWIRRESIDD